MDNNKTKREMKLRSKTQRAAGGVYAVKNTVNDKWLVEETVNMTGSKNRFDFALKTGSCVIVKIQGDWDRQNGKGFEFEILEEIEKIETQTDVEFKEDIKLLKEIWLEKLSGQELY